MADLYHMKPHPDICKVLEEMRDLISKAGPGVTLTGNRLTVRFYVDKQLVDAHMVIIEVTTADEAKHQMECKGGECRDCQRLHERYN